MSSVRRGHLKKIAITGGIGSGKSSLVRELSALGYPVFDADRLVSEVVCEAPVQQQICALLGDEAYAADESGILVYQRAWVRDRVFNDPVARKSLEKIIHPALFLKFDFICHQLQALAGGVWVFYEAALIFESGRERDFDAVVSVVAAEDVRHARLSKARNLPVETINAIFAAQVSDDVRRAKSHFVVENSANSSSLASLALVLVQDLRNFFHPRNH